MSFIYENCKGIYFISLIAIADILEEEYADSSTFTNFDYSHMFEAEIAGVSLEQQSVPQQIPMDCNTQCLPGDITSENNIFKRQFLDPWQDTEKNGVMNPLLGQYLTACNMSSMEPKDTIPITQITQKASEHTGHNSTSNIQASETPERPNIKELSLLIVSEELKSVIPATRMFSKICRQRLLQEGLGYLFPYS